VAGATACWPPGHRGKLFLTNWYGPSSGGCFGPVPVSREHEHSKTVLTSR
jgi:hypothetical protein